MNGLITNHVTKSALKSDNTLHVIGVCSNPVRYHSRYMLAREFITEMVKTPCVKLHVVEASFGDRSLELEEICTQAGASLYPLKITSEAWIKESMINIGFRRVTGEYPQAKYFAWIDMDVFFRDPNWAQETLHQLQHFPVVQPWQDCADLGPHGGIQRHFRSFGYQHQRRAPKQKHPSQKSYEYAHSGFAWAATRGFLEQMWGAGGSSGPLMDFAILGSADHHMAFACIGETQDTIHKMMHPSFFRKCYEWQDRAMRYTKGEVGFCQGRIEHKWHGKKNRRFYRERWQILVDHEYDPDRDLMHDAQGLVTLVGKPSLEQAIRLYNRSRLEDDVCEE